MPTWNSTLVLCIALLGVASLAAGGAGAVGAERGGIPAFGTGPAALAWSQHDDATVSLDRSTVSLRQGEAATIELTFQGTDEATIVVGGDGAGDNVTATVTDSNGDGVVPLAFETEAIGTMRTRLYPVDDGDDYGTVNASEFGGPLPAGEYPISVYVGHGVSGEPSDAGTLIVNGTTTTEPPEDTTTETTTALPDAFIAHSGEAVTLHARSEQVVAGATSLDAGQTVTVRLRSSGDSPFLKSAQADVGDDGAFAVSFDLSDVEAPANATAVVTVDGDRIAGPVDVAVVGAGETSAPETSELETSSPGQSGFGVVVALGATFVVAALVGGWRRVR